MSGVGKVGSFLRTCATGASRGLAERARRRRERQQRRRARVAGLVASLTQRLLAWRAEAREARGQAATSLRSAVPRFASGFPRVPAAMIAATAVAAAVASPAVSSSFQKRLANLIESSMKNFVHAFEGPRRDTLVLLLSTTLVVPIMTRLKTSPILGFLLTGMVLGPRGLSIVSDIKTTEALAELGIVFFLFEMGLELSVERLIQMRRDVFGLGFAQFSVSAPSPSSSSRASWGVPGPTSVVVGGALALSSSAFVLQLLRDKDSLGTRHGRPPSACCSSRTWLSSPPRRDAPPHGGRRERHGMGHGLGGLQGWLGLLGHPPLRQVRARPHLQLRRQVPGGWMEGVGQHRCLVCPTWGWLRGEDD